MRQNETISLTEVASGLRLKEVRDLATLNTLLKRIETLGFVLYHQGDNNYCQIHLKEDENVPFGKQRSYIVNSIEGLSGFLQGYESCLKWNLGGVK